MIHIILYCLSAFAFVFAIYNSNNEPEFLKPPISSEIQLLIAFVLLIGGLVISKLDNLLEQNLFICKQLKKDKD